MCISRYEEFVSHVMEYAAVLEESKTVSGHRHTELLVAAFDHWRTGLRVLCVGNEIDAVEARKNGDSAFLESKTLAPTDKFYEDGIEILKSLADIAASRKINVAPLLGMSRAISEIAFGRLRLSPDQLNADAATRHQLAEVLLARYFREDELESTVFLLSHQPDAEVEALPVKENQLTPRGLEVLRAFYQAQPPAIGLSSLMKIASTTGSISDHRTLIQSVTFGEGEDDNFLRRLCGDLKTHGYLESSRGSAGGYWLTEKGIKAVANK